MRDGVAQLIHTDGALLSARRARAGHTLTPQTKDADTPANPHRRARIAIVEADGSDAVLSTAIDLPAAARCTALVHLHQLQMD